MLDNQFIEESLTEALKALDKHIRANDDVYKKDIENGLSIMLDDLKDIEGIAYINISYLYSNVLNNRTELLVTAYGEDWYVGDVLYEREIQFGDFFNILPSYAENLYLESKKSMGSTEESYRKKIILDVIKVLGCLIPSVFRKAFRKATTMEKLHKIQTRDSLTISCGEYLDRSEVVYLKKNKVVDTKDVISALERKDLEKDYLSDHEFKNLKLEKKSYRYTTFSGCHFNEIDFLTIDFQGSNFINCTFENTSFESCTLLSTLFRGCTFENSSFESINDRLMPSGDLSPSVLYMPTSFDGCKTDFDNKWLNYIGL